MIPVVNPVPIVGLDVVVLNGVEKVVLPNVFIDVGVLPNVENCDEDVVAGLDCIIDDLLSKKPNEFVGFVCVVLVLFEFNENKFVENGDVVDVLPT